MVARKERGMREKLSPQEKRMAWLYAALIVLVLLACAALAQYIGSREHYSLSLPPAKEALLDAARDMDNITIDAVFDPESKQLTATQVMTLRNPAGSDLDNVTLRSYSGAYLSEDTSPVANDELFSACYGSRFSTGGLILDSAAVNGEKVRHAWGDDAKTVLTLPRDYAVASTGWAEPAYLGDAAVYTLEAQAVRDFALVISDRFAASSAMADDVLITAYAKDASDARRMVKYARQAIECYEEHYGEYLCPTLTLAEVSFPYGGMEYPRMVMIGSSLMAAADDSLEVTVAHEVAHQWWYAMVGSDSYYQAWQDESLCEYALMDYVGQVYGASARESLIFDRIETAMRITIPRGVTPGSPIDYFQDLTEYSQVVYRRGAALWTALETLMGKQQLDSALQQYVQAYRFSTATRQDLARLLSQAAGQDVTPLMEDYLDTYIAN